MQYADITFDGNQIGERKSMSSPSNIPPGLGRHTLILSVLMIGASWVLCRVFRWGFWAGFGLWLLLSVTAQLLQVTVDRLFQPSGKVGSSGGVLTFIRGVFGEWLGWWGSLFSTHSSLAGHSPVKLYPPELFSDLDQDLAVRLSTLSPSQRVAGNPDYEHILNQYKSRVQQRRLGYDQLNEDIRERRKSPKCLGWDDEYDMIWKYGSKEEMFPAKVYDKPDYPTGAEAAQILRAQEDVVADWDEDAYNQDFLWHYLKTCQQARAERERMTWQWLEDSRRRGFSEAWYQARVNAFMDYKRKTAEADAVFKQALESGQGDFSPSGALKQEYDAKTSAAELTLTEAFFNATS